MNEIWKSIPGYEGLYEASSEGRIKSIGSGRYRRTGRVLKTAPDPDGYRLVTLCKDGVQKKQKVHRLVAAAFYGPSELFALHGDGDPANNQASNLRWGTALENSEDRRKHGRNIGYNSFRTHCRHGHPFEGDNLYTYTTNKGTISRGCVTCRRARGRAHRRKTTGPEWARSSVDDPKPYYPKCDRCDFYARWGVGDVTDTVRFDHVVTRWFACGNHLSIVLSEANWNLDTVCIYDMAQKPERG